LGFSGGLRYGSTPSAKAEYYPFGSQNIIGTDNFQTTLIRQNTLHIFLQKYAESMQKVCSAKTLLYLTLSTYLVLQQLSLFQTNTKPLKPNVKILQFR
jgi:hypothetical protein